MTYEERLQKYAQMHSDKWRTENGEHSLPWETFREEAEVTCAAVAEAIRRCALIPVALISKEEIEQYLIENGYVPKP